MFTLYHTVGCLLDGGIYHTRSNGEIVRKLNKEDADYGRTMNRKSGTDEHYFFIIEYEKGDIIRVENYEGKSWYTTLNGIKEEEAGSWHYFINIMCKSTKSKNKDWLVKLDNLLKELLPEVFKYMTKAGSYQNHRIYTEEYRWIVERLGKNINDYVSQNEIDEYVSALIRCYDLAAIEEFLKEKEIKISDEVVSAYEKAKKDVAETIKIAKVLVETEKFDRIIFEEFSCYPSLFIFKEGTPCGKICINITYSSWKGLSVMLVFDSVALSLKTTIDITEECKDFAEQYESRNWQY